MSLGTFVILVALWFMLGTCLLVLAIRAYSIRTRLSLPLRTVENMTDYQDIFSTLTRLSSLLQSKRSRLFKRSHKIFIRKLALLRPINTFFLRPPTFNTTRIHLPYAYANLSEVSRRRFREDPDLLNSLQETFALLTEAIFHNKSMEYCHYLAQYYRLMRFPTLDKVRESAQKDSSFSNSGLMQDLKKIQTGVQRGEIFQAYQCILRWNKNDRYSQLDDFALLSVSYLTARLESMVQGAEYLIQEQDIHSLLDDISYRIEALIYALPRAHAPLILDAIG